MPLLATYRQSFSKLSAQVWILALSMFINRSGSMVLLFASLFFTKELGFTLAQAGSLLSFYGFGGILGSFAGGWFADRFDLRKLLTLSQSASGLILWFILLAQSFWIIGLVLFAHAFFADFFRPVNSKAIGLFSSSENRTRSVSLVRLAANLGFSVGPALGGFLAWQFGYRILFFLDGATTITAGVILWTWFDKNLMARSGGASEKSARGIPAWKDTFFVWFVLLTAFYGVCFFQLFASIPQYFSRVSGYNETEIGWMLALNGAVVVLFEMPVVAFLEKFKNPFLFIIVGTLCIPVSFAILWFTSPNLWGAGVYTVILTFSEIFAMPFMMSLALTRPSQGRQGEYASFYTGAFGVSVLLAPSLGLFIADNLGFGYMLFILSSLALLVAFGFFLLKKRRNAYA